MQKIIHFLKYNNATVIILAVILILGGGAFAAGPENIGQKQTSVQGLDNTALLAADLDNFNMDFKIENIQADENYYYATYSYLDLVLVDGAWQYQLSQTTRKVSKKIKEDIGVYLAKYLAKHYEARLRELKSEKNLAQAQGEQKRIEVTEYSGLVGRTLDLAAKIFPGYEPVKKIELPAPEFNLPATANNGSPSASSGQADNLTQIYNDYIAAHPELELTPDVDSGAASSTPTAAEPEPALAETENPAPSQPEPVIAEPESVEVIELPAQAELPAPATEAPAETPPAEPAPAPAEPAPETTPIPQQ